jgi:hypothetical protein
LTDKAIFNVIVDQMTFITDLSTYTDS